MPRNLMYRGTHANCTNIVQAEPVKLATRSSLKPEGDLVSKANFMNCERQTTKSHYCRLCGSTTLTAKTGVENKAWPGTPLPDPSQFESVLPNTATPVSCRSARTFPQRAQNFSLRTPRRLGANVNGPI